MPGDDESDHFSLPAQLTTAQREAIMATDPLLCVLAGAGSGKTRVLTMRVARRVFDGSARPDHVLVCTFSRKAANELEHRLWRLRVGERVAAGTFHRWALTLLSEQRSDAGRPMPQILDDRRILLAEILAGPRTSTRVPAALNRRSPKVVQLDSEIGWAKARLIGPEEYADAARRHRRRAPGGPDATATLFERYEELRRARRVLDLDDLLLDCAAMLETQHSFADAVRWRFRHLFVDEMQDVNPAQFRLLTLLLGDEPDLFVVGDPNQSIYGWNGADPTLLHDIERHFPGTRTIRLDENHRCTPQVVRVANAALDIEAGDATSSRPDGPLPQVVSHDTDAAEATWLARAIRLAHRPGRKWSQIAVLARTNRQLVTVSGELRRARIPFQLADDELGATSDLTARHRHDEEGTEPATDDADLAIDDPLDEPEAELVGPGDGVVLSTFHRAKGLQWPATFVIGLSDGLVPIASARSDAARREERRLLYVALTRAEDELWCSWARSPDTGDNDTERNPSPWLAGIERSCAILAESLRPPDPAVVAANIASIRATLSAADRSAR